MKWPLSGLFSRSKASPPARTNGRPAPSRLQASFDTQWLTGLNVEHWAMARSGDAQISFNYQARRRSRWHARYEAANNAHLRGMVDTKASDLVGCVSLQMHEEDQHDIEKVWNAWACEIGLHEKLTQLVGVGKITDGEGLALLYTNERLYSPIKLDVMNFESEQMGNRWQHRDDANHYDGIFHEKNYPLSYYIYDYNPDTHYRFNPMPYVGEWYDPSRVLHLFKRYRVGQLRGATELGPALEYAAILRRYTLATLSSAELAAETGLIQETDAAVDCPAQELDGEAEFVPWSRNMMYTAPYGWKVKQLKPEQPVEQYNHFVRSIVTQMGRSLGIPAVLCFGDSSDYNMASGRLDIQAYIRSLEADRMTWFEPACLEKIFMMFMRFYAGYRSGMLPSDINEERLRRRYPHSWTYRQINHSDPEKQASADVELWHAGLLTDAEYLYARNVDPETHYEQLKVQNARRASVGMPMPGMMPGMPGASPAQGANNGQQNSTGQEETTTAEP